ncbi:hypothetical protein ACHQM5_016477 [Ranunculus cassubicifolius]
MDQSTVAGGWSELPAELLDSIIRRLNNYIDYIRVRSVCPLWRSNLPRKPKPYHLVTQIPWLLLPTYKNNSLSETRCSFFNLAENKPYLLDLPEVLGEGKRCWGSPHGWIVLVDEEGPFFSLLNPLTKARIHLPSLFYYPSSLETGNIVLPWDSIGIFRGSYIVKAVLIANPLMTEFVVMVIMERAPCALAFFKSGTEAWTLIAESEGTIFHDLVCFQGEFYAVDSNGTVYLLDLSDKSKVVKIANPPEALLEVESFRQSYLVESENELLLVYRYFKKPRGTPFCSTSYFTAYKLALSNSTWSQMSDLTEQVLFLGTNCSFSLSARDYPSCRGNSIYFTDDQYCLVPGNTGTYSEQDIFLPGPFGFLRFKSACIRGHDWGIFGLANGVEPLPGCPVPDAEKIKQLMPAPLWVTISP